MAKIKRRPSTLVQGADLTPMIDVVFLLLIFFMVATSFVEETQEYQIELPKAEEADVAKIDDVLSIVVHEYDKDDDSDVRILFRVDGKPVSRDSLFDKIREQNDTRDLTAIVIKADKDARYQDIVSVISCLHGNGMTDFSLAVLGN